MTMAVSPTVRLPAEMDATDKERLGGPTVAATAFTAAAFVLLGLSAAQTPAPADKEQIARGHKQFQQSCGFCNGADATGALGDPQALLCALAIGDIDEKPGEAHRFVVRI